MAYRVPKSIVMTDSELKRFLDEEPLAFFALVRGTSPHITPLNFMYDGKNILISVGANAKKVKHITENNKVAVCVHSPYRADGTNKGVIFEGEAEILMDDVEDITRKIFKKGHKDQEREDLLKSMVWPRVIIKVKPKKVISWDYSKLK